MLNKYKKLTTAELTGIQELSRIAMAEGIKATHFEQNTALLNVEGASGKSLAEQQKKVAELMERVKNEHVNATLAMLGYSNDQKVSIDLKTGKITVVKKD